MVVVLALVIAVVVTSSRGTNTPDDSETLPQITGTGSEETIPSSTEEGIEASTTTFPTDAEITTSFIQGTFIGEFEQIECNAEGLKEDDGSTFTCDHPNELIFDNTGDPIVSILDYTIPVSFDGTGWTKSVELPSPIPNCEDGNYMVVVEIFLKAVDASPSSDSPTGWHATRLEGSLSERSIATKTSPDCPPYSSSHRLFNFIPRPVA